MHNLSKYKDFETANTHCSIASKRAANIAQFKKKDILELCVGPSLSTLEKEYKKLGLNVTGNDIEFRWKKHYPNGKWLIGNCFDIDWNPFDMIVFAPPLSKNCSGKREDSLMIESVNPSYYDFIKKLNKEKNKSAIIVLPARSISTKYDRNQYYKLLSFIQRNNYNIKPIEMKDNKNIRKYIDVFIDKY